MKGLRQMRTRFFCRRTVRQNVAKRAEDFKRWCKHWMFILSVLSGVLADHRRKGFYTFQNDNLTACNEDVEYYVKYWHPRVTKRIVYRFRNGYGAIVTIAGGMMCTSSIREIVFPSQGCNWFEEVGEKQNYWRLPDLYNALDVIRAREEHPEDSGFEDRVPKEQRYWPELWIRKHPDHVD